MYSCNGLVNQISKALFSPTPILILSFIIVHSGKNQDNFLEIMYINHFRFFLSLAISNLAGPPAKSNVKQQDRDKLWLVKSS